MSADDIDEMNPAGKNNNNNRKTATRGRKIPEGDPSMRGLKTQGKLQDQFRRSRPPLTNTETAVANSAVILLCSVLDFQRVSGHG